MRPGIPASLLVAAATVLAACGGGGQPASSPTPTPDERVEQLTALRDTLGPPAGALATAERRVTRAMEQLRTDPPDTPEGRVAAVEELTADGLAGLEAAAADLAGTPLPDDAPAGTAAAVDGAVAAAGEYAEALTAELDVVRRVADAGREVAAVTAAWTVPGSFSEQLARLDAAAGEATELAARLRSAAATTAPCGDLLALRAEVSDEVVAVTAELAELVRRRQGEEFVLEGERAREMIRTRLAGLDATCPHAPPEVVEPRGRLATAIYDIERALNPPDLVQDPW